MWWKNLLYIGIYDFGLDPLEYPILGVGTNFEGYICYDISKEHNTMYEVYILMIYS